MLVEHDGVTAFERGERTDGMQRAAGLPQGQTVALQPAFGGAAQPLFQFGQPPTQHHQADTGMLRTQLGYLRSQGHEVVLMRVLDPAEVDFEFAKPAMFVDMESGKDLYIDPVAAREEYRRRFGAHAAEIEKICRELGIGYHRMTTSQPLELTLFDFLQSRLHAGRQVARAGNRHAVGS